MQKLNILTLLPVVLALTSSCSSTKVSELGKSGLTASQARPAAAELEPMRLHTEGNQILNASNKPVLLYGVNIASLEWSDNGDHVQKSVEFAIHDWKANLIRLPLAQDRWFGKTTNQIDGGAAYRANVDNIVSTCAAARVYIDLDLHWSDCGTWANKGGKIGQHIMPDKHSVEFWRSVATRYSNHPSVIFGLYNEPHDVPWNVWRDGAKVTDEPAKWNPDQTRITYQAVGMQKLYRTVRATGAANVVTVSGLDWGYDLSGMLKGYALPSTNLVYETHPYAKKKNWGECFGKVSEKFPVYIGEWGFTGGGTNNLNYARNLLDYAQQHRLSWTAWDLHVSAGPTLIRNWSYEPTVFGQIVKEKLAEAAEGHGSEN
jgi:hypothetical protein